MPLLNGYTIGDPCVIERDLSCDIVLSPRYIALRQARIERAGSKSFLIDMGTGCGVFIDGERVACLRELKDGDQIKVANYLLEFTVGGLQKPR